MWSLNSNSILVSPCKQLDCKQRAAHGEGSQKRKFASSSCSPRIMGFVPRGCIAVCRKSDGECSWWVPRLYRLQHGVRKGSYGLIRARFSVLTELAWKLTADCNWPAWTQGSSNRRHRSDSLVFWSFGLGIYKDFTIWQASRYFGLGMSNIVSFVIYREKNFPQWELVILR